MEPDKDTVLQIFNQYLDEYDLYEPILPPDIQESCNAQWSKSSKMIRFANTEQELDEIILRAKKLIKFCEYRYWDTIKNRNPIEAIDYTETISNI